MNIDEKDFFRQVTLRICGRLEIEKALWQCLLYIQDFLPASQMSLHIYHREAGVVETVASATREGFRAMAMNSQLSDLMRKRIGGSGPIAVDIRVIAATHRNLEKMLGIGAFREDLYFRLRVFPVSIPPLRSRMMDLPALVQHFIQKKALEMKRSPAPGLAPGALDRLMAYHWPGNVRELENAMTSLHIRRVLDMCQGRVEGEKGAAGHLNTHPSTLRKRMRKLGIPFGRSASTASS